MAAGDKEVRIDKWLWAVQLFKTRSIAIEACKKGRISIKGVQVKASRMIKVGDIIEIRKPPITYSFEVLDLIERRVGAKLAADYRKDVTTPEQLEVLEMSKLSGFVDRARGTGRPTKKDRRELETFIEDGSFDFDFDFDDED